jgi:hypothetical protein
MPSTEDVLSRQLAASEQLASEQQARFDAKMQEIASDFLIEKYPRLEQAELAPACITLAGLVRKLAIAELMLPVSLSRVQQWKLLDHLCDMAEADEFTHVDSWEEGMHTLYYLGEEDDDETIS